MKKLTTQAVIKEFKKVHGDKYDYSKVEYVNAIQKVKILCIKHGIFLQSSNDHKSGKGCPKCSGTYSPNTEEIIKEFQVIHRNKYDYSKLVYITNSSKVIIICPHHGEFEQRPSSHRKGAGCPACGGNKKLITQDVIKEFKKVHGDKYDYSKVEFKNSHAKVRIVCKKHGEFMQVVHSHRKGAGCPKCFGRGLSTEEIIKEFKKVHGDKYDYSKVKYSNIKTPILIICKIHGKFSQIPDLHKQGGGCPRCGGSFRLTSKEVISNLKKIHGSQFDYSEVNYVNSKTPVTLVCKIHGTFQVSPSIHKNQVGCPKCYSLEKK